MKFSTREDIAAPVAEVFAAVSDFESFERAALRRGAEVSRTDRLSAPGPGMAWDCAFAFRGKGRRLSAELQQYDAPESMVVLWSSSGLVGTLVLDLVQLSPRQTRMMLQLELKPRTIPARLFVQSLRLAKASLTKRFKRGVRRFARDLDGRLSDARHRV
ncbi:MAG: SRPBCC family protein [Confluentimicrobium sp.]|jgi:hypothetical protein|uniref:SRPBCC family protein n=1 Tax=Actibacterium sp. TaxID=1872125 RepID=UPI0005106D05|nr:SRPBCC family protein [Actibacterium sp.]KGB81152.1 DNA polymerase III subunit gamma/tau [Rhodovulum sp. NI22]MBC58248.1 SRPBCC family protein [Actibacterium sp.]MDY6860545.1 SRPBCC family protein [Pseudomonadota bacterium]|tara:strand:+ start:12 stop:488 length:477 start_codon:yes stop_codon:yes gene_type:complete